MLKKTISSPIITSALFTPAKDMICNFRNDTDPTNITKSASGFIDDINYEEILRKVPVNENILPLVVRAVSAGEWWGPNDKHDFFPEQELKEHYETFLTAHVFFNHDNKDVRKACGPVYDAFYDTKMHCVIICMGLDLTREADTAKAVKAGYLTDVSMGCGAGYVSCPLCGTIAYKPTMRCEHLKNNLGQIIDNQLIYEITHNPKFYDISLVLNGADRTAKIYHVIKKQASLLPYVNPNYTTQQITNTSTKPKKPTDLTKAIKKEATAHYLNSITEPIAKQASHQMQFKKEASLQVLQQLHKLIQSLNPNEKEVSITISLSNQGKKGTFLSPNELHTLLRGSPLKADFNSPDPNSWLNPEESLLSLLEQEEPVRPRIRVFRAVRNCMKPWALSQVLDPTSFNPLSKAEVPDLHDLIPTIAEEGKTSIFPTMKEDPTNFKRLYRIYITMLPSASDPGNLTEEEQKEVEGSLLPTDTKLDQIAKDSVSVKVSSQPITIDKEAGLITRTLVGTPLIYGLSGYYEGKAQEGYPLNPVQESLAAAPIAYMVGNTLFGGKAVNLAKLPFTKLKGLLSNVAKLASYNYKEEDEVLEKLASLTQDIALQDNQNSIQSFLKTASDGTFNNDPESLREARNMFLGIVNEAMEGKVDNLEVETYKAAMEDLGEQFVKEAFLLPSSLPFDFLLTPDPSRALLRNAVLGTTVLGLGAGIKGIGYLLDKQKKKKVDLLRKQYQQQLLQARQAQAGGMVNPSAGNAIAGPDYVPMIQVTPQQMQGIQEDMSDMFG